MNRHRNIIQNFICLLTITAIAFTLAAVPVVPVYAADGNITENTSGNTDKQERPDQPDQPQQRKVLTDEETIPSTIGTTKTEEKTAQSGNTADNSTGESNSNEQAPKAGTAGAENVNGSSGDAGAGSTDSTETERGTATASQAGGATALASSTSAAQTGNGTATGMTAQATETTAGNTAGAFESTPENTQSGEASQAQAVSKTESTAKADGTKALADTVITSAKEAAAVAAVPEAAPVEATVTPGETDQTTENGVQTETQAYGFDFVLTQEQVDSMLGRPQINLGNGADGDFIISVAKQVNLESIEKGKPSQLEFTVVTEFAKPTDKVQLAVTTTEGYDRDYNFILNNMSSNKNAYVGGYAFIYDKDEYDADATGKKFRPDHFTGQTERVFDAAEIGTEKRTFPMVCELVLDDDLHAGHWAGVMQFAIRYDRNVTVQDP